MSHATEQPDSNPYQSPLAQRAPAQSLPEQGKCPTCGSANFRKASFTWWGGALGPKLFNHVKCVQCGTGYNSITGRSNTRSIVVYQLVVVLVAIVAIATVVVVRR